MSLVFVGTQALVAWTALLAAWRLLPEGRTSARLVLAAIVALSEIVVVAQVLGAAGVYAWPAALGCAGLIAAAAHAAWARGARVTLDLRRVARVVAGFSWTGRTVVLAATAAWLQAAWRALTSAPLGWDALTYHLPFAASFVQTGTLAVQHGPLVLDFCARYPKNAELVTSWFMLAFRSDLTAGLPNVLLLGASWLVAYALGRALDLDERDSGLAALAVAASPFAYSFASGANTDLFVLMTTAASVLFLVRWLDTDGSVDAAASCAAAGLALGAKYTALALAVPALAVLAWTMTARAVRHGHGARALRTLAVGALLLLTLGGRQYVENLRTTGNPAYPVELSVGGRSLLPTSPYSAWLLEQLGEGSRADDRVAVSGLLHYYPTWKSATSAGPKYALLFPLALLALVGAQGFSAPRVRLLVALALVGLVVAIAPAHGLPAMQRRFWPVGLARFIAPSLLLCAVAAMTMLARVHPRAAVVCRFALGLAIAVDAYYVRALSAAPVAAAVSLAAVAALAFLTRRAGSWAPAHWLFAATGLAVSCVLVVAVTDRQHATRSWIGAASASEADDAPKTMLSGWDALYDEPPLRIALAVNDSWRGQSAFAFPLMGRRLQHTVGYVPVSGDAAPGSAAYVRLGSPDRAKWEAALDRGEIGRVVVQEPWPVEDAWMRNDAARFTPVFQDGHLRIYKVVR